MLSGTQPDPLPVRGQRPQRRGGRDRNKNPVILSDWERELGFTEQGIKAAEKAVRELRERQATNRNKQYFDGSVSSSSRDQQMRDLFQ
jgi:hypothetical protein